jgi:hypothetical protein
MPEWQVGGRGMGCGEIDFVFYNNSLCESVGLGM